MKIVQLDPQTWGQSRLFSAETWPDTSVAGRQYLASQVVDALHRRLQAAEINARWIPRVPLLELQDGVLPIDRDVLNTLLEESYAEVRATWAGEVS